MTPDAEMLRQYAELNSEEAFTELVRRHLDLVYSTALRQVNGDAHLAQDVAQTVFTDLARKAPKLSRHPALTGWLYTSAYFAGCKAARTERRRHAREQEAQAMQELLQPSTSGVDWEKVRPVLDQAMHELKESERTAILMRYFENRAFAEMGAQLGLSEDAARKRVDRALTRLQTLLAKRGIATGAALAAALSANAVQTSPAGLAATLASAALFKAAANTGSITALFKFMAATKLQTAFLSAIVLASILTPLALQHQAQARWREQEDALRQQTNQLAQLSAENRRLADLLAQAKPAPSPANNQLPELLRLRSEVGQLRRAVEEMKRPETQTNAPLSPEDKLAAMKEEYAVQVARLKSWLDTHPAEKIPEMQQASEKDWIEAVSHLEEHDDFASAASTLRHKAEEPIYWRLQWALQHYVPEHDGQFPSEVSQLKPYLPTPTDNAILQRYTILPAKSLISAMQTGDTAVITQAAPVNEALDSRAAIGVSTMYLGVTDPKRWSMVK